MKKSTTTTPAGVFACGDKKRMTLLDGFSLAELKEHDIDFENIINIPVEYRDGFERLFQLGIFELYPVEILTAAKAAAWISGLDFEGFRADISRIEPEDGDISLYGDKIETAVLKEEIEEAGLKDGFDAIAFAYSGRKISSMKVFRSLPIEIQIALFDA